MAKDISTDRVMALEPALALLDLASIAAGLEAADAMAKRAQIDVLKAGTVQPGRFLILVGGTVADVEESLAAGAQVGGSAVLSSVYLPAVHPEVVHGIGGKRAPKRADALGVVETSTVPAAIKAADAGLKGADVSLVEIRLADGLGGKGIVFFSGVVADVEAAVDLALGTLGNREELIRQVVIPQLHPNVWQNVSESSLFAANVLERL